MEVHAHTHTERKKWIHYLWVFLMLFLAVFCGFLAENYREKIVNRENKPPFEEITYGRKHGVAFTMLQLKSTINSNGKGIIMVITKKSCP